MSGEVRLWWVPGYRPMLDLWTEEPQTEGDGEDDARAYIALPAAEFEKWRRVVEAAKAYRAEQVDEFPRGCDVHRVLVAAVDALPSARKEGPK